MNRQHAATTVAFLATAAATWSFAPRPATLPPLPPISDTVTLAAPVRLRAPAGRRVAVAIARTDGGEPIARLELRDGAEATLRPGTTAGTVELATGFVRLATASRAEGFRVRAAGHDFTVGSNADVAFELHDDQSGEKNMRTVWLVSSGAVSGAALTLAVLVARGQLAWSRPTAGQPALPPPGQVAIVRADETAGDASRRAIDLEQKVAALRQENGRLAGQLARNKGVTTASVLERIATMKDSMAGVLTPGAFTDLLTDIKGLGAEGVATVIKMLSSGDEKERALAARLLEQLDAPSAIPALRKAALEDKAKGPAVMASHALALMDDAATVPSLREIAAAPGSAWEARVNALWGLCKHGDAQAIGDSLALMKDEKQPASTRSALGVNLLLLPDPELLPIADETVRAFGKNEQVGTLAVAYYEKVGTPEARARLEAMTTDASLAEGVHQAAREALQGKPPAR